MSASARELDRRRLYVGVAGHSPNDLSMSDLAIYYEKREERRLFRFLLRIQSYSDKTAHYPIQFFLAVRAHETIPVRGESQTLSLTFSAVPGCRGRGGSPWRIKYL
jgi:hypothetical protein